MIVVGCLSLFECEETIGKTLKTIEPFVDRIIVVDGSYEGFSDHVRSKDGTMIKVKGFHKPKIIIGNSTDHSFRSEMTKRNFYMDFLDEGEWGFIIDGDEWIGSGVEETLEFLRNSKESCHSVMFYQVKEDGNLVPWGPYVRLFQYVKGMKYVGNHLTIKYPDGRVMPSKASAAPLHVVHDQRYVPQSYLDAKKRYDDEIRPLKETKWLF